MVAASKRALTPVKDTFKVRSPVVEMTVEAAMNTRIFAIDWADFCASLRSGTLTNPFLVRETEPDQKPEWYLYAQSPDTLVQVMTYKKKRRSWRTVDGAIRELEREFEDLPTLMLFGSVDAVKLADHNQSG